MWIFLSNSEIHYHWIMHLWIDGLDMTHYAIIFTGIGGEEIWTASPSYVKIIKEEQRMKRLGYDEIYAPIRIATFKEID